MFVSCVLPTYFLFVSCYCEHHPSNASLPQKKFLPIKAAEFCLQFLYQPHNGPLRGTSTNHLAAYLQMSETQPHRPLIYTSRFLIIPISCHYSSSFESCHYYLCNKLLGYLVFALLLPSKQL